MAVTFMKPSACRPREKLYETQISKAGVAIRTPKIATVLVLFKNKRQPKR